MKKYRFQFTKLIIVFLVAVFLLCGAGLGWNIYNLAHFDVLSKVKIATCVIMCVLCAGILAIALSIIFSSYYTFKDDALILRLGIFKSVFLYNDMVNIALFRKTNKMVIYLGVDKFTVIVINPKRYDDFIDQLRENKPSLYVEEMVDKKNNN